MSTALALDLQLAFHAAPDEPSMRTSHRDDQLHKVARSPAWETFAPGRLAGLIPGGYCGLSEVWGLLSIPHDSEGHGGGYPS